MSGFPTALFTIEDDPVAIRASAQTYRRMSLQAQTSFGVLRATTAPSWRGIEGDVFRERKASYEPMLTTAARSFATMVQLIEEFADTVHRLRVRMDSLRANARQVWAQLQAAEAAQLRAGAALAAATAPAVSGKDAGAAISSAQRAFANAGSQVNALQSRWHECVASAERLHQELAQEASLTASTMGRIEGPPSVPSLAAGGASPVILGGMTCEALPPSGQAAQSPAEQEEEAGFFSSAKHLGLGLARGIQVLNPLASGAEKDQSLRSASQEFGDAAHDVAHAGQRVGNGLYGFGQAGSAGVSKLGSYLVSPFSQDFARQLEKASNDTWIDGTGRIKKDGLYSLDVISNVGPGGLAKGALAGGGKVLLTAGSGVAFKTGAGAVIKHGAVGGVWPVFRGQRGVNLTVKEIQAAGGTVLGREVTLKHWNGSKWIKTRPDLYVRLPNGSHSFIEVKTGPFARHTRNQQLIFPEIRKGNQIYPTGRNSSSAGLALDAPLPPMQVWTVRR